MEMTADGCLKILLSAEDLAQYALSFDTLDYRDTATRTALRTLMDVAAAQVGFTPDEHLLIEAVPVDDGCLLLVTPEKSGCRIRLKQATGPYVYRVDDTDRLLQMAKGLSRFEEHEFCGSSSLYRCDDGYRLVLYPLGSLSSPVRHLFLSLTEPIGEGDAAAAYAAEHGTPLAVGDALDRLMRAYSA